MFAWVSTLAERLKSTGLLLMLWCPTPKYLETDKTEKGRIHHTFDVISYQLKLKKMRAELTNLNHCAVPFLSRTDAKIW